MRRWLGAMQALRHATHHQAMVQERVRRPVLTSPLSAVTRLKKRLQ